MGMISFRCSDEEEAQLQAAADKVDLALSKYVRWKLFDQQSEEIAKASERIKALRVEVPLPSPKKKAKAPATILSALGKSLCLRCSRVGLMECSKYCQEQRKKDEAARKGKS